MTDDQVILESLEFQRERETCGDCQRQLLAVAQRYTARMEAVAKMEKALDEIRLHAECRSDCLYLAMEAMSTATHHPQCPKGLAIKALRDYREAGK